MTDKTTITPKALALEIGVDPKSLRGWLRSNYTRPLEAKNTTWLIDADAADAARAHYRKQRTDATPAPDTRLDLAAAWDEAHNPEVQASRA